MSLTVVATSCLVVSVGSIGRVLFRLFLAALVYEVIVNGWQSLERRWAKLQDKCKRTVRKIRGVKDA
jgi:hypothetical protein